MNETVMIALIGVGGGIVGAGIGGTVSLAVATLTRKHQREDREDLRWAEERLANYLRFLSATADLEQQMQAATSPDAKPSPGTVRKLETTALMAAFNEMRLIAPGAVVELANRYSFTMRTPLHTALVDFASAWGAQPLDSERAARAQTHLDNIRREVRQLERELRIAMRRNLGTGPEQDLPELGRKAGGRSSGVGLFVMLPRDPKHPGSPSKDDPGYAGAPSRPKHPGPPSKGEPWM
jgi:hypothetical protein